MENFPNLKHDQLSEVAVSQLLINMIMHLAEDDGRLVGTIRLISLILPDGATSNFLLSGVFMSYEKHVYNVRNNPILVPVDFEFLASQPLHVRV